MKTFLVPTDFSDNAENALFYAVELAKREQAKIILFNAYTISDEDLAGQTLKAHKRSEERLKSLGTKIEHAGGVEYECISKQGAAVKQILDFIKNVNVDLVIMGTKGESNFSKVIFGSNTAHIVEKSACPVIAVPEGASYEPIKKMTYATNYLDSDILALKEVVELAKPYNAQVNILHIANKDQSPDEERAMMEKFKKEVEGKIEYNNVSFQMLSGENAEQELKEYLDAGSTDMLIMSTHYRTLWDKMFRSSLTNQMAYNSPVPLMAFHYNKEAAVKLI